MHTQKLKIGLAFAIAIAVPGLVRTGRSASFSEEFSLKVPVGIPAELWSYFIPRNNPLAPVKVELGRQLFFDQRLSADGSVSCATCHEPKMAFADGRKTAEGIGGRHGARN